MKEIIHKLNKEQLIGVCESYERIFAKSSKECAEANTLARQWCHQNSPPWTLRVNENVNAVIRAAYREGPFDSFALTTLMAAAEQVTIAELAREALTDEQYRLLSEPMAAQLELAKHNPKPEAKPYVAPSAGRTVTKGGSQRKKTQEGEDLRALAEQFGVSGPQTATETPVEPVAAPEPSEPVAAEEGDLDAFEALLSDSPAPPVTSVEEVMECVREEYAPIAVDPQGAEEQGGGVDDGAPLEEEDDDFMALMEAI